MARINPFHIVATHMEIVFVRRRSMELTPSATPIMDGINSNIMKTSPSNDSPALSLAMPANAPANKATVIKVHQAARQNDAINSRLRRGLTDDWGFVAHVGQ